MTHGMVLGKFMPPHRGHIYLCEFARSWSDTLTIVVGSLPDEPIAGALRFEWMRELFPSCRVVHLTDNNPQYPHEHPDFWAIWRASLQRVLAAPVDLLFASDDYGAPLAKVLGARFVAVDTARSIVPISGTTIRNDPATSWHYLPRCVRPHFVKRVSIMGPESTGKTTLAQTLARALATQWVPEWARTMLTGRDGRLDAIDWMDIVRGQIASEESLARDANEVLVCDTDPLATTLWAESLAGACPDDVRAAAKSRRYELTLLTAPDVPWVADTVRYLPSEGASFFARCKQALQDAGRPYVVLSGSWESREQTALTAVRALMGQQT